MNENQKDISRFCLTDKSYFIIEKKETVTILFDSTKLKKLWRKSEEKWATQHRQNLFALPAICAIYIYIYNVGKHRVELILKKQKKKLDSQRKGW